MQDLESGEAAVGQNWSVHWHVAVGDLVWLGQARRKASHILASESAAAGLDIIADGAAQFAVVKVAPASLSQTR